MIEAIGIGDGKGNISFNKMVTTVALGVFAYAVVKQLNPPWSLLTFGTVVVGAGFGLKGYMAALAKQQTNANVNESVVLTGDLAEMIAAVKARRDPAAGIESAGRVPEAHRE